MDLPATWKIPGSNSCDYLATGPYISATELVLRSLLGDKQVRKLYQLERDMESDTKTCGWPKNPIPLSPFNGS